MLKRKCIQANANVALDLNTIMEAKLHQAEGYVRFMVQSKRFEKKLGRRLYLFDHRPAIVEFVANNPLPENHDLVHPKRVEYFEKLQDIVNTPARVSVMEKEDKNYKFNYVNLFQTTAPPEKINTMLSTAYYIVGMDPNGSVNGYSIKANYALWMWLSRSEVIDTDWLEQPVWWEDVLVMLTTPENYVIVEYYGDKNGLANAGKPQSIHFGNGIAAAIEGSSFQLPNYLKLRES